MLCFQTEPAESSASIFKPARKTSPEQPIKRALVQIVLAIHHFPPVVRERFHITSAIRQVHTNDSVGPKAPAIRLRTDFRTSEKTANRELAAGGSSTVMVLRRLGLFLGCRGEPSAGIVVPLS